MLKRINHSEPIDPSGPVKAVEGASLALKEHAGLRTRWRGDCGNAPYHRLSATPFEAGFFLDYKLGP